MVPLPRLLLCAALALTACTPADRPSDPPSDQRAATPLPTRQTTIDPVNRKLDAAAQDVERRRQAADDATK